MALPIIALLLQGLPTAASTQRDTVRVVVKDTIYVLQEAGDGGLEWTPFWTAVGVIAAAFAAWASWRSAAVSEKIGTAQATWNQVEKRHLYYRLLVIDPCIAVLNSYRISAQAGLADSLLILSKLKADPNCLSSEWDRQIDQAATAHQDILFPTISALTECAELVASDELRDEITRATENLEQSVVAELEKITQRNLDFGSVQNTVTRGCGQVIKVIRSHDPAFAAQEQKGELS